MMTSSPRHEIIEGRKKDSVVNGSPAIPPKENDNVEVTPNDTDNPAR